MNPRTPETEAARIRGLDDSWLAAAEARDIEGMMANYAIDAYELLPDMAALVGRDAIRAFYASLMERLPRFTHTFVPEDIVVSSSCDLAVVRGHYEFTPDAQTPADTHNGKYVGVWRRLNDEWRLIINISNGNGAP